MLKWLPGGPCVWAILIPVAALLGAVCLRAATAWFNHSVGGKESPDIVREPKYETGFAIYSLLLLINVGILFVFYSVTGTTLVAARKANPTLNYVYPIFSATLNLALLALLVKVAFGIDYRRSTKIAGYAFAVSMLAGAALALVLGIGLVALSSFKP